MDIELKCSEDKITIEKSSRIIAGYFGDKEGPFTDDIIKDVIKPVVKSGIMSEEKIKELGYNEDDLNGLFIINRKTGDLIIGKGVEVTLTSEGQLLRTEGDHQHILLLKPGQDLTLNVAKVMKYAILVFLAVIVAWGIIVIIKKVTSVRKELEISEEVENTLPNDTLTTYDVDIIDNLLHEGYLSVSVKPSDNVKFYVAYSPEDGNHIRWETVTDTLKGMEKLYPKNNCTIYIYATDQRDSRRICRKKYEFDFCQYVEQLIKNGNQREIERTLLQGLKVIDYGNNCEDEGEAVNTDVLYEALKDYHIGEIVYGDGVNWQSEIRNPTYPAIDTIKLK